MKPRYQKIIPQFIFKIEKKFLNGQTSKIPIEFSKDYVKNEQAEKIGFKLPINTNSKISKIVDPSQAISVNANPANNGTSSVNSVNTAEYEFINL